MSIRGDGGEQVCVQKRFADGGTVRYGLLPFVYY